MKQIKHFRFYRLTNGAYYTFLQNIMQCVRKHENIYQKVSSEMNALGKAFEEVSRYMKIPHKSALTDDIAAAHKARAVLLMGLKKAIKANLSLPNPQLVQAATVLWNIFSSYRINPYGHMDSITGLCMSMVQKLQEECKSEIELLSLESFVNSLGEKNNQLRKLLMAREDERDSYKRGGMLAARKKTDVLYLKLVDKINALAIIEGDTTYTTLINGWNEQVIHFKRQVVSNKKSLKEPDELQAQQDGDAGSD